MLEERSLHLAAARKLRQAYQMERQAIAQRSRPRRGKLINEILQLKAAARDEMIVTP